MEQKILVEPELPVEPEFTNPSNCSTRSLCYTQARPTETIKNHENKNRDRSSGITQSAYLVLHGVAQVVVRVWVICLEPQSRAVAADRFLLTSQAARDGTPS